MKKIIALFRRRPRNRRGRRRPSWLAEYLVSFNAPKRY